MKRIVACILIVTLAVAMSATAYGYDFRDYPIQMDERISTVFDMENVILEDLQLMGYQSLSEPEADFSEASLDYENAIYILSYSPAEFLEGLEQGFWAEMQNHENYVWKIPVKDSTGGYGLVRVNQHEDGSVQYVTATGKEGGEDCLWNVYRTEEWEGVLQGISYDALYVTSINNWHVDFITVVSGEEVSFIPYAIRSDLLEVENGQLYSSDAIHEILQTYQVENAGDFASGGGAGGGNGQWWFVAGGVCLLVCCTAAFMLLRWRKTEK